MQKDPYTITLDAERRLAWVVARGELNREMGNQIITEALTAAITHEFNILCDVKEANVKVTLADWFYLPRTLAIFKNEKTRVVKTAVLVTPGQQEDEYEFYETVLHNLGMKLKVFTDENKALDWLKRTK